MNNVVIGILPTINVDIDDNPYNDKYSYCKIFNDVLNKYNASCIGIIPSNGILDENILNICDGFLLPGGNKVDKVWYEIIYYCLKNNKPLLGICLGSEAIDIFSVILDKIDLNTTNIDEIINTYQEIKKCYDGTLLRRLPENNIHCHVITKSNFKNELESSLHPITIKKNTILHSIYQKEQLLVPSFHSYDYKLVGSKFVCSAMAKDNVCEAIEYNDSNYFIVGVHYHPELINDKLLFSRFIWECQQRKK